MFCGIGRNKDGDCKKPPKSPIVFGDQNNNKKPSVSPITTKTAPTKRSSVSPIQISDKTFEEAVKELDVPSESGRLADKYGLVAPGNLPGRAYNLGKAGHPAYAFPRSKRRSRHTKKSNQSKKKGGRYKKRKTRRRKRRKTRKKRKRKKRRRKTRRN
tara:strand:+ start:64 stop:534 length:471 start_codon:yes stop_codon:yes gene_type:complete